MQIIILVLVLFNTWYGKCEIIFRKIKGKKFCTSLVPETQTQSSHIVKAFWFCFLFPRLIADFSSQTTLWFNSFISQNMLIFHNHVFRQNSIWLNAKGPEKQAFLLSNIITGRNENEPHELCKNARELTWQADPASLPRSPSVTYPGFVMAGTRRFTISGHHVHLCFASLGLGDNTHSPEWSHRIPEADPLHTCRENKTSQCTCTLWVQNQGSVWQIKQCSTVQTDFLSSFLSSI